jgi:DNA-binding NarL/FixJ family response regulator
METKTYVESLGHHIAELCSNGITAYNMILLTRHNEIFTFNRAKALNVNGYVLKEFSTDVLEDCINAVLNNETWFNPELSGQLELNSDSGSESLLNKLTFAEKKIVQWIGRQHTTKEIAQMLFISEKTVENHRSNIIKKLALPAEKNALLVWAVKNIPFA